MAAVLVLAVLFAEMAFSQAAEANEVGVNTKRLWVKGNTINFEVRFTNNGDQIVKITGLAMKEFSIHDNKSHKFVTGENMTFTTLHLTMPQKLISRSWGGI